MSSMGEVNTVKFHNYLEVMKIFQDAGFKLKELIIKQQHNCRATGYWKNNSVKYKFLQIAHEYLFEFKKYIKLNMHQTQTAPGAFLFAYDFLYTRLPSLS